MVNATFQIIDLDWWPLTRDCGLYIVTIGVLTVVTFDEKIEWYEALILTLMYITYFLIMWGNGHLMKLAKKLEVKIIGSKTVLNDPGKLVFCYFDIKL
jgi:Ca2+/Na+ antiporter